MLITCVGPFVRHGWAAVEAALDADVLITSAGAAQDPQTIPSPDDFLGYALGERFTPGSRAQAYLRLLDTLSPLAESVQYGTTPEHRDLVQVVLTATANHARLDEILAATDPELESVEGVGDMRAKDIREGLRRLQEINLVDRYLQT